MTTTTTHIRFDPHDSDHATFRSMYEWLVAQDAYKSTIRWGEPWRRRFLKFAANRAAQQPLDFSVKAAFQGDGIVEEDFNTLLEATKPTGRIARWRAERKQKKDHKKDHDKNHDAHDAHGDEGGAPTTVKNAIKRARGQAKH